MKFLLLLAVIGVAIWMFKARHRVPGPKKPPPAQRPEGKAAAPTPMLVCAHCGVHLPKTDAVFDPAGRAFCSAAHLQAGAR
ncbi:MAG: hypothetical protein C0505_10780 [Leptothrix sp. (in: Bacteria)]|nr:hypothetical protein [Leptothrix sp. (in: b-proteobacteria)]